MGGHLQLDLPWVGPGLGGRQPQASVSYPQRGDKEAPASGTAWMSSPSCAAAPHPGQVLNQLLSRTACSLAGTPPLWLRAAHPYPPQH